jgi:hypothetical protein
VWLALRLGWTLAEVYGRLGENPPPDTPSSSTRLFLSDLNPSPNERLWAATQRLIYLVHRLFPPRSTSGKDEGEQEVEAEELRPGLVEYPKCLDDLLQRLEQRMPGRGKLPRASALYDELNQWSRQVWAILDSEDPLLAEATTLGGRLADTFWQWRFPVKGQSAPAKQAWPHLLKRQRMTAIIRQVRLVETHLPAHVGSMLRHSLSEWSIAGELTRSSSGELEVAYPRLYRWRSLGWARARRRRRMKARREPPLQLRLKEGQALWRQLRNQIGDWERLVFGRPLARLLRPSDWRQVRWHAIVLYAGAVFLITAGIAGLIWLVIRLLGYLFPFLAAPTEFKEQLTLASTLVAVLGFLATQFRRGLVGLRHLYDSIYTWVMMRKLEHRSLRLWNGETKPLRWVWLRLLLRAED